MQPGAELLLALWVWGFLLALVEYPSLHHVDGVDPLETRLRLIKDSIRADHTIGLFQPLPLQIREGAFFLDVALKIRIVVDGGGLELDPGFLLGRGLLGLLGLDWHGPFSPVPPFLVEVEDDPPAWLGEHLIISSNEQ